MNLELLSTVRLFRGISRDEIRYILNCVRPHDARYPKGAFVYRAGDEVHTLGIVVSGAVSIESNDFWGNRTILDRIGPGGIFAETYACVSGEPLLVNVVATEESSILFLDVRNVLTLCPSSCTYHQKIVYNLLQILAQKNLHLSRRSFHTAPKTIRARLLSFLSDQALQQGSREFSIRFNRQQLADYLNVDRSALSAELSKMKNDGLLRCQGNRFVLTSNFEQVV